MAAHWNSVENTLFSKHKTNTQQRIIFAANVLGCRQSTVTYMPNTWRCDMLVTHICRPRHRHCTKTDDKPNGIAQCTRMESVHPRRQISFIYNRNARNRFQHSTHGPESLACVDTAPVTCLLNFAWNKYEHHRPDTTNQSGCIVFNENV